MPGSPWIQRSLPIPAALVFLALTHPTARAEVTRELLAAGFAAPVHVAAPPNDPTRLFVVERAGFIRIVNLSDGSVLPTPFLNVNDAPSTDLQVIGEGGLLSLAFHPNYGVNGHFFVFYTPDLDAGAPNVFGLRVSRFTVSGNPDIADPNTETIFFELSKTLTNHNGGMVAFKPNDPNHYLYVSVGDGGNQCDPDGFAQDITTKFGKILRIDVDLGPSGDIANPFAPASNPFVGILGDDLIWALGLRNPYRFSFDRATGDMYIGDVGLLSREEVNFQSGSSAGGENYGWNVFEGFLTPPPSCSATPPALPDMVMPLHDFVNDGGAVTGGAVTGGNVYRGSDFATLVGRYYFADWATTQIWSFVREGEGITDLQEHTSVLNPDGANITGFGESAVGELYFTTFDGEVVRIVDLESPPVDADQDLLSDGEEITLGTDPNNLDTDGDGVIDGTEVELGTDPLDGGDFPLLPALRGGLLASALAGALLAAAIWLRRRARY